MSCDICAKASCAASFHSLAEQAQYADVIEAFDRARKLRLKTADALDVWTDIILDALAGEHDPDEPDPGD